MKPILLYEDLDNLIILNQLNNEEIDWFYYIMRDQQLSEDFIRKHSNMVDWKSISIYQKLSEAFIEEFKDKVHWNYIYKFQSISSEFKNKYKEFISYC